MSYYSVKVRITSENERGALKSRNEDYLVDAMSVTEAEARITKDFEGFMDEWEVIEVKQSKIHRVIEYTE